MLWPKALFLFSKWSGIYLNYLGESLVNESLIWVALSCEGVQEEPEVATPPLCLLMIIKTTNPSRVRQC